jgi:peptide/nickel transport system permease protein
VSVSTGFLRRLLRRPVAIACLVYLVLVVLVAIIAPIVLPNVATQNAGNLLEVRLGPSLHHLLGTDDLGRDVLQRLLVGTRVTILAVAEATVVTLIVGVPFGLVAGFFGGWIDSVVTWLGDLTFSMPWIVVLLVVLAVFPQNLAATMVVFGVLLSPGVMRVVRSAVLAIADETYVVAARVSGLTRTYIMTRHVLPRIAGAIIVQAALVAAAALIAESALAALNLVVVAPAPSWGGMISDGVNQIVLDPWLIWPPGLAVMFTILALGLLSNTARDANSERWSRPAHTAKRRTRRGGSAGQNGISGPESEREALLTVDGLTVAVGTPPITDLIEDVSFSIRHGEAVAIVGESGCGKSITAMSILGLLPGTVEITTGQVMFDGLDLAACGEDRLRQIRGSDIALISQEPMVSLDPVFRVGTQVADVVRRHERCSRRAARRRALELLERVRLPDPKRIARRYPHELSGGMAQRIAIARALAGSPRLLIADEPTTALDVTVQAEILDLLREIQTSEGMAILLVTHDWGVVADLCQRAVVMYAGQVIERADVSPVFRQPLHPYTAALLAADPHRAAEDGLLPTIPGTVPTPGSWPVGCHFQPRCRHATADCAQAAIPILSLLGDRETRCIHHEELVTTA